jgi:hypothetical protein
MESLSIDSKEGLWVRFYMSATTTGGPPSDTAVVKRAKVLAKRIGVNPKTIVKRRSRKSIADLPTGLKKARSPVLSVEEEAKIVAFRKDTLLPLDGCLYALRRIIPHLTRWSLHRCLKRHGISRRPQVEGEASPKLKFKVHRPASSTLTSPRFESLRASSDHVAQFTDLGRDTCFPAEIKEKIGRRRLFRARLRIGLRPTMSIIG